MQVSPRNSAGSSACESPSSRSHNPLVIPIGDTPAVSGGPFQDWPAVVGCKSHGLRDISPARMALRVLQERGTLLPLSPQLGDAAAAEAMLARQAAHVDSLIAGRARGPIRWLWFSSSRRIQRRHTSTALTFVAIPALRDERGSSMDLQIAEPVLEESEEETLESVEVGPGLRPWGEDAASTPVPQRRRRFRRWRGRHPCRARRWSAGRSFCSPRTEGPSCCLLSTYVGEHDFDDRLESIYARHRAACAVAWPIPPTNHRLGPR